MREQALRRAIRFATAAALGLIAGAAPADEIRYLAWDRQHTRAAVETPAGAQWVGLGDAVPGFGTVVDLDEEVVLLRRILPGAEREALEGEGLLAPWAEEMEVLRWDLRFIGLPLPPDDSGS